MGRRPVLLLRKRKKYPPAQAPTRIFSESSNTVSRRVRRGRGEAGIRTVAEWVRAKTPAHFKVAQYYK